MRQSGERLEIRSGVKELDELTKGGLPTKFPTCIFSVPNLGKSFLAVQYAMHLSRQGIGSLYIDTEGFLSEKVWQKFCNIFQRRWSDVRPDLIKIIPLRNVFRLYRFFGIQVSLEYSKARTTVIIKFPKTKKKVQSSTRDEAWYEYSQAYKTITNDNIGLLILDSLSAPIKLAVGSATQNLPARADLQRTLLDAIITISDYCDIASLIITHISKSPTVPQDLGRPYGGQEIGYFLKHILLLKRPKKEWFDRYSSIKNELREIRRIRWGIEPETFCVVRLKHDWGYDSLDTTRKIEFL